LQRKCRMMTTQTGKKQSGRYHLHKKGQELKKASNKR